MFKLRFWWMVLWALIGRRKVTRSSHLRFWVTPFDCDINFHMNNASYLKFMDLGRWDIFIRGGMLPVAFKIHAKPVVVRIEIDYKKGLPPGTFFTLDTAVKAVGTKSFQMHQIFKVGGQIVAEAIVTAVFIRGGHAITIEEFIKNMPLDAKPSLEPIKRPDH